MAGQCPNFFILGAPKCGTTSLATWLADHVDVIMSVPKEPHYFNSDMKNRGVINETAYLKLFEGANAGSQAVGEASTWYLYSRDAVSAIERIYPNVKYIVMVRDAVSMAQSLYYHNIRHLHENAPTFEQAWELQEARKQGREIPSTCADPVFLQYRSACSLGKQLERLLFVVPRERVLVIELSELNADPKHQYQRVVGFLGLMDDGRDDFLRQNEARMARSVWLQRVLMFGGKVRRSLGIRHGFGLLRINERNISKASLSDGFLQELENTFLDDKKRLSACLEALRK